MKETNGDNLEEVIDRDGNCLFRSFAYFLYNDQNEYQSVRSIIVSNVVQNWNIYEGFLIGDESHAVPIIHRDSYYNYMSQDNTFGSEVEIVSFVNIYKIHVMIYRQNFPVLHFGQNEIFKSKKLVLRLSGSIDRGHYDVISCYNTDFWVEYIRFYNNSVRNTCNEYKQQKRKQSDTRNDNSKKKLKIIEDNIAHVNIDEPEVFKNKMKIINEELNKIIAFENNKEKEQIKRKKYISKSNDDDYKKSQKIMNKQLNETIVFKDDEENKQMKLNKSALRSKKYRENKKKIDESIDKKRKQSALRTKKYRENRKKIDESVNKKPIKIVFKDDEEKKQMKRKQSALRSKKYRESKKKIDESVNREQMKKKQSVETSNCYRQKRKLITIDEEENLLNIKRCKENEIIEEHYLGPMNLFCKHCGAVHFNNEKVSNKNESFNDCCGHGTVKLDPIPEFPNELQSLFSGNDDKSKVFLKRIRIYNNLYAFASFNANLINFRSRNAPYCFKIQGQIYYQINEALYPDPDINENPTYGQLFIIDPEEAINYRATSNDSADVTILRTLEKTLREHNILAKSYEMMCQEIAHQRELTINDSEPELQLLFNLKAGYDKNRYNFQRTNEVAAVFLTTADGEIPESYVTIRNKNTQSLKSISSLNPLVEPMIYPLFYPHGTEGWKINMKRRKIIPQSNNERSNNYETADRNITRCSYIKYRISIRPNEFNAFLLGGRLFQQWIVDNYVKVEKERIQYCKDNQKTLRAESYQGLIDHLNNTANNTNCQIGKMIILPSTFVSSPRYMMQNYQDSMAIVRKTGKPDLFITMTCNPNWNEIKENLLPNQQASDRPDICARVFHLKKEKLIDMITKRKYFGEAVAYVYVVEFQKRGLPHAHILLTLKYGNKLLSSGDIDKYISAEIPDPEEDKILFDIVTKNMIHGPCNERCMLNGKCTKYFPKEYQEETTINADGYPLYRRKNNGITIKRNNRDIDNRFVVPYNPGLLRTFNCHINVEVVCTVKSVKYLYKYVYKGHDAATIEINEMENQKLLNHDEIKNYIDGRYVSPVEACYRVLSKPLQGKNFSIMRQPVHLPRQQIIIIDESIDRDALSNVLNRTTMLLDYFKLNVRDINARKYLYTEIPSHYVFKQFTENGNRIYKWAERKTHFNVIGRIYSVSPTQIELFHLRLLLLNVRGATSFDDLKTVDGQLFNTFSETCLALGLIEDDNEWDKAMKEAETWMMPYNLRCLFVRILIHCQPIYPELLWDKYKDALSEDFFRSIKNQIRAHSVAYMEICDMLIINGNNISNFPTMPQNLSCNDQIQNNEHNNDNLLKYGIELYNQLNTEQKKIVDVILKSCDDVNNDNKLKYFYIDGPGGTGKTFVYNTIFNLLQGKGKNVCTMAFTGIAATLLPKGRTVHKVFGLPVPLLSDSSSNIKMQSKEAEFLQKTDVFIWDEAPMAPRYALEIMNRTLKDVMNNDILFGNKIVILGGDFRQLLPVLRNGTRSEIINLSIKNSNLWNEFQKFHLTQNMRAINEQNNFADFVLNVGNGTLNDKDNNIAIPNDCVIKNMNVIYPIFGELIRNQQYEEMNSSAILSARNADVDDINYQVMSLLDNQTKRIYTSIDSAENCDDNGLMSEALLPEYLNTLNPSNLPPHELHLNINCIIMLIRNISIHEGLCNGTRLRILDMSNHLLKCKVLTGDKVNTIVFINRITLYSENEYPFTFKRRQFPIKLAFAMTINKAQGQTFSNIAIDLRRDVFTHGQLYVAISRVRSWKGLKFFFGDGRNAYNNTTKNYVFKEILS